MFTMRALPTTRSILATAAALISLAFASGVRAGSTADTGVGAPVTAAPYHFSAPTALGQRDAASDVQWRRQDDASLWFARVSLGESLPQRALSGEVQWLFGGWQGHLLTVGALAQRVLQTDAAPPVDQRLAAYVNDEWQLLPGWRLLLGARADRAAGGEQSLAPRAALLWQALPSLQIRLQDGVALRDPSASLSPQVDPSLGNERLRATELGLDWRAAAGLRLAASLYRNQAGQPSDSVATGLSQGPLQLQNLGRANGNGVELGSEYAAEAGWQLRATWAASRAHDHSDAAGTEAASTLAKLQAAALLPWRGLRAGVEWWHAGAPSSTFEAQHLLNATLDWAPRGTPWTLAAGAYNLTGRTLADAGSGDALPAALLRDGRRLQLQLARTF